MERGSWQREKSQGSRAGERRCSIITITMHLPTIQERSTVKLSLSSASRTRVGTLYLLTLKFTWQLKYYPNAESSQKQQRACVIASMWNPGTEGVNYFCFSSLRHLIENWRLQGHHCAAFQFMHIHFPDWHLTALPDFPSTQLSLIPLENRAN